MNKALFLSLSLITLAIAAPVALGSEGGTHECRATAGAALISLDLSGSAGIAIGGCSLVVLTATHMTTAVDAADGCEIKVDLDDDGQADEVAVIGKVYHAPAEFVAFCELGVLDAVNSITLA